MAKKIALLNMFCGFRMDSGVANSGIFAVEKDPRLYNPEVINNVVVKLSKMPVYGADKIRFTDLKKEQADAEKLALVRDGLKSDLSAKLILDMYKKG